MKRAHEVFGNASIANEWSQQLNLALEKDTKFA